ncbi:MAG: hypothetical protein ACQER2_10490, partial [Bacillota bacterium]
INRERDSVKVLTQYQEKIWFKPLVISVSAIILLVYFVRFFQTGVDAGGLFYKETVEDTRFERFDRVIEREVIGDRIELTYQTTDKTYTYTIETLADVGTKEVKITEQTPPNRTYVGPYPLERFPQVEREAWQRVEVRHNRYTLSLSKLLDMAFLEAVTIRGQVGYLLFGIFFFALATLDLRFPRLFFTIEHILSVRDPEPTDFYRAMRKLRIAFTFIVGIVLFIAAII